MVKNTNRKMLLAVAMVLCIAMFVGSTYAWFTDSVSSGTNQIVAGNLDVELNHKVDGEFEKVDEYTALFTVNGDEFLWEPGAALYETFQVSNEGTLALKYFLSIGVSDVNYVTDDEGNERSLKDVLTLAVVEDEINADETSRTAAIEAAKADDKFVGIANFGGMEGKLLPKGAEPKEGFDVGEKTFTVILYWEPNVENDNDYNLANGLTADDETNELTISLAVNLVATQVPYEQDSFDDQYDADAQFPRLTTGPKLAKATELKGAIPSDVTKIVFCDYTEDLGKWEDGEPVGATKDDDIRLFTDGTTVYICVQPGVKIMFNENSANLFSDFTNVESIDFGPEGLVSTEKVTSMQQMFYRCKALTSLDLSGWDVSNVTNMAEMFRITGLVTLDLSGWDVSNVRTMRQMFRESKDLKTIYADDWDASTTDSTGMFVDCESLPNWDRNANTAQIQTAEFAHTGEGGYFTAK